MPGQNEEIQNVRPIFIELDVDVSSDYYDPAVWETQLINIAHIVRLYKTDTRTYLELSDGSKIGVIESLSSVVRRIKEAAANTTNLT